MHWLDHATQNDPSLKYTIDLLDECTDKELRKYEKDAALPVLKRVADRRQSIRDVPRYLLQCLANDIKAKRAAPSASVGHANVQPPIGVRGPQSKRLHCGDSKASSPGKRAKATTPPDEHIGPVKSSEVTMRAVPFERPAPDRMAPKSRVAALGLPEPVVEALGPNGSVHHTPYSLGRGRSARMSAEVHAALASLMPSATSLATRRHYYYRLCQEMHGCRKARVELALGDPSDADLERMRYFVELTIVLGAKKLVVKRDRDDEPSSPALDQEANRFFRRWGSDRLLFVGVPNSQLKEDHLKPIELCDRRFVLLCYHRTMASSRHLRFVESGGRFKQASALAGEGQHAQKGGYVVAVYFAECGRGLEPLTADRVREWHLPYEFASDMTVHKYAERFKLGLSNAKPTVELKAEEIRIIPDTRSASTGEVLTDGCGLISWDIADEVAELYGHPGRRISCLQVRLGPAKGMLVRSDVRQRGVDLTESMKKYGGHEYYYSCPPEHRCLEVCHVVFADQEPKAMINLNFQLILVLQACGCPAEVFLDLERRCREDLQGCVNKRELLLKPGLLPSREDAHQHGSSLVKKILDMLDAGIGPEHSKYMVKLVGLYLKKKLENVRHEGHVPCPRCWRVKMVPDFGGRLRPACNSEPPPYGTYRNILMRDVLHQRVHRQPPTGKAVEDALAKGCVLAVQDAQLMGTLNCRWRNSADRDISLYNQFREDTLILARLQEFAVDAPKTGYTLDLSTLPHLDIRAPHWVAPDMRNGCRVQATSRSALGRLADLQSPETWSADVQTEIVRDLSTEPLVPIAKERVKHRADVDWYLHLWKEVQAEFRKIRCDMGHAKRQLGKGNQSLPQTYEEAAQYAREIWVGRVDAEGRSRELFALAAFDYEKGDSADCWELCFDELCRVSAESSASHLSSCQAGRRLQLRTSYGFGSHTAARPRDGQCQMDHIGPPILPAAELTRVGKWFRNATLMRGPPDGGDLSHAPAGEKTEMDLDAIRFTHDDVSDLFKDGRPLQSTVQSLLEGKLDPLKHDALVLCAVYSEDEYWSLRNRRLWALKEYQRRLQETEPNKSVHVYVRIRPLSNAIVLHKFIECFSTQNRGTSVKVRRSSRHGESCLCENCALKFRRADAVD